MVPMEPRFTGLADLDKRSREIFRNLVETYLETGDPIGSRTLSRALPINLSPASVRNVMADLEEVGLICAPHTSAGRIPTEHGLRMFVDGLLEIGGLADEERATIDAQVAAAQGSSDAEDILTQASNLLSGLSRCAGVVVSQKADIRMKHLEFVPLDGNRALAVLVGDGEQVENRVLNLPAGLPAAALPRAANFLNARFQGKTLSEIRSAVAQDIALREAELDELTANVVKEGIAIWSGPADGAASVKNLIVRGRANLIEDETAAGDLERVRQLFDDLESKKDLIGLLGLAEKGEGVRIFIGSENKMFSLSGSSLVVAPYHDTDHKVIGVLGVIGPTRLNYGRIIPMVDYTAQLVGRLLT
ncbi:MAG: heat-inducible transcriptional repressor HrcA [Alphaproteobacteria bacterium]|nr:heat-inducible transcriptional repressor HrcA [Alphaproteobacteria bacterium]